MMAVLLAAIVGSMLLIGCSDTENGNTPSGRNWMAQTSNVNSTLYDVHYANNLWVAVGGETTRDSMENETYIGAITTSTNGIAWTARASNASSRLLDIHYANNLWVAVGTGGVISTSTNGTVWTARTSNVSGGLRSVHYAADANGNNGLWVAAGWNGTTDSMGNTTYTGIITTSTNGAAWTARTSNVSGVLADIHYANNLWVAAGWNPTTDSMGNTTFTGIITTSANGTAWTAQDSKITSGDLQDVHYAADANGNNGLWVATGWNSTTDSMGNTIFTGNITTSANGATWTARDSKIAGIDDVYYANNLWIAVGSDAITDSTGNTTYTGGITTSTNGTTWTARDSKVNYQIIAIHYANNVWVAVGADGTTDSMGNTTYTGAITTSANGTTWTARDSEITSGDLRGIHYANNVWVAVGADSTTDSMGNTTFTGAITTAP